MNISLHIQYRTNSNGRTAGADETTPYRTISVRRVLLYIFTNRDYSLAPLRHMRPEASAPFHRGEARHGGICPQRPAPSKDRGLRPG